MLLQAVLSNYSPAASLDELEDDDDVHIVKHELLYIFEGRSVKRVDVKRSIKIRGKGPVAGTTHFHQYYGARGDGALTAVPKFGCALKTSWKNDRDGFLVDCDFGTKLYLDEEHRYGYEVLVETPLVMEPILRANYVEPGSVMVIGAQFDRLHMPIRIVEFLNEPLSGVAHAMRELDVPSSGYIEVPFEPTRRYRTSGLRFQFPGQADIVIPDATVEVK
jgi:hypothetical protein